MITIHFKYLDVQTFDRLGACLSGDIPRELSISAICLVLMPHVFATFFWQRLCTFMLQT